MPMVGHCLCGGVTVTLPTPSTAVGACHCAMCRRWCSGPWLALQRPDAMVTGETLQVYRGSRVAERGFCGRCGSAIFHRPVLGPELAVSAGLFDSAGFELTREIFHDRQPPFYRFEGVPVRRSQLTMALAWAPRLAWRALSRTRRSGRGAA